VDRGIIQENLKDSDVFIGEYQGNGNKDNGLEYQIGRCLKCGLCLEACPNYVKGENFFGPLFAND
jgi:Succinate dehydrogenase/fumarate reductase, Fe-S protein subunit